jgi:hypothetical protein
MIYSISKGSSKTITRVALNNKGYPLNLTGATISITAKQYGNASITLFTKTSADSTEIEVIDASRGIFLVKFLSGDTSAINYKSLYCAQTITIGSNTYTDTFFMRVLGVTTGIAIESFVLSPYKYVVWKCVNGATPVRILKAGFANDVTASISGNNITLTSTGLEFDGTGECNSNFKDFSISTANTQTIVMNFDDISSRTISFWWGDPTRINISNSGYTTSSSIDSYISSGTTAQMTAKGLTLTTSDIFIWKNTQDSTYYFWSGTEWV